jgi:uncharacterized protein
MREVISNTSPLQYLYQAELLDLLPRLYGQIIVPESVVAELAEGHARGIALPDPVDLPWVVIASVSCPDVLTMVTDLGPGEREVLFVQFVYPADSQFGVRDRPLDPYDP